MDIRKAVDMDRPHHDHSNRVKTVHGHASAAALRYQYEPADDIQYRYRLKLQEMQNSLSKVTEERDKVQKKLEHGNYMYAQAQAYAQKMKFEQDKMDQRLRQIEQRYSQSLEELQRTRGDLDDAVSDRDSYKYQLSELQREHKRVSERVHTLSGNLDAVKQQLETVSVERDRLKSELSQLKTQHHNKQPNSCNKHVGEDPVINDLTETNAILREKIAALEEARQRERDHSPNKVTLSRESLGHQSSDESFGRRSKGRGRLSQSSISEDSLIQNAHSTTELANLDHSSANSQETSIHSSSVSPRRMLSASASNLSESMETQRMGNNDMTIQLRTRLTRLVREKETLIKEVSEVKRSQAEYESLNKTLQEEMQKMKDELSKSHVEQNATQEQIQMIIKQKGVMIEKSAASYEQSVQLQTKLLELQAEKAIFEKQRDVATKERDRVVTESFSLKKKLETIKSQRQKDAKELSAMRRQRDRALQELDETNKSFKDAKAEKDSLESQYHQLGLVLQLPTQNTDHSKALEPVHKAVEQLKSCESDYYMLLKKVFGSDSVDGVRVEEAMAKIEHLLQEKCSMLEEISGLQVSVRKQNEDRIFDLKQAMENLYMERDGLQSRNKTLSTRVGRLEAERDKLRQECERLDQQCQDMNATISSPTGIERLWRESQTPLWEQAWEMKRVQVPLGQDGFAGFTVVGGRDQPQLPNTGAFIITSVNKGGPADGVLRLGDVLESINHVDLACATHQDAVKAVKESSGSLDIMLRRRKKAHAVQVGIAAAIMSLGQEREETSEQHDFSLMVQKEGLGFQYEWETHYNITSVTEGGPAHGILKPGDRIVQVASSPVHKEKHSQFKKLLKPHKGVLRLIIERKVKSNNNSYLMPAMPPMPAAEVLTPTKSPSTGSSHSTHVKQLGTVFNSAGFTHSGQDSTISEQSQDSAMPEKMVAAGSTHCDPYPRVMDGARPSSDGVVYGFNDRRGAYDDDDFSEPLSTGYSASESFLSEPSSYDCLPMDSSQTSIELTFHSVSQVSHNRLTVQSTMSTQPKEHSSQDDSYFARVGGTRTTFRNRAASDSRSSSSNSQLPEPDTHQSRKLSKSRRLWTRRRKQSKAGSLSQLPTIDSDEYSRDYSSSRHKSHSNSMLAMSRGRSRSNVSLSTAPSMSSVIEEPFRTLSTTSLATDPLADATYIRANYSYVPHHPKELSIEPGNVFHIFDDVPPERHRRSFWVSQLNADGSDARIGSIPNTTRAQEWLHEQGHALELPVYEEVEPYTGMQPVLICGVLAHQITSLLAEGYPKLFHMCQSEILESTARITEARLNREQSEGKIIHYQRLQDLGYRVITSDAITCKEAKGKHVLLAGNGLTLHTLKTFAPPISILVKAGAEDSIRTFGPEMISHEEAQMMYRDARDLEEQYGSEFTSCLTLVYEDTLLKQITDIIHKEKHNQVWVPINRLQQSMS